MQALIGPIASGIIGAIASAIGVYIAITNRLTRIETMIENLRDDVEKHNSVMEKTFKLEADSKTLWKRHDELTGRVERLEHRQ